MGKSDYLGNKILQSGKGSKNKNSGNNRGPYSSGLNPYSQFGGAKTKKTPRRANDENAAAQALLQMAGPATPDSGIDVGIRGRRKRKRVTFDLPTFDPDTDTVIIPKKRTGPRQPMGNDIKAFLAQIRPPSNKKTEEPTGAYSINSMLNKVGMIRKGRKRTRPHTIVNGWYMHGRNAGKPRPGRRAAMIRAYVEKALRIYKRLGSQASSSWLTAAKTQRGRGFGVGETLLKHGSSMVEKVGKTY